MSTEAWIDEQPNDKEYERGLHERELEKQKQEHAHREDMHEQRKEVFYLFKKFSPWMMCIGYIMAIIVIFKPSTQGAIIAGIVLMIPIVIMLAMIRMLYTNGNNSEKTAPSIMLNVGKELGSIAKMYIKGITKGQ
jgi:hypothetical protein